MKYSDLKFTPITSIEDIGACIPIINLSYGGSIVATTKVDTLLRVGDKLSSLPAGATIYADAATIDKLVAQGICAMQS